MTPRQLEASLLLKAAAQIQAVADDLDARWPDLAAALEYDRKLWTILIAALEKPENPMPKPIRQNVISLGVFILGRILEMAQAPTRDGLAALVSLNRELATGLRSAA